MAQRLKGSLAQSLKHTLELTSCILIGNLVEKSAAVLNFFLPFFIVMNAYSDLFSPILIYHTSFVSAGDKIVLVSTTSTRIESKK